MKYQFMTGKMYIGSPFLHFVDVYAWASESHRKRMERKSRWVRPIMGIFFLIVEGSVAIFI